MEGGFSFWECFRLIEPAGFAFELVGKVLWTLAYLLGRDACYDGVGWHILGYYTASTAYGSLANGDTWEYHHVAAKIDTVFNLHGQVLAFEAKELWITMIMLFGIDGGVGVDVDMLAESEATACIEDGVVANDAPLAHGQELWFAYLCSIVEDYILAYPRTESTVQFTSEQNTWQCTNLYYQCTFAAATEDPRVQYGVAHTDGTRQQIAMTILDGIECREDVEEYQDDLLQIEYAHEYAQDIEYGYIIDILYHAFSIFL